MRRTVSKLLRGVPWLFLAALFTCAGCVSHRPVLGVDNTAPRELTKVSIREYVISPPDILLIDAVRLVPKPPYKVAPLDALFIQVNIPGAIKGDKSELLPGQPIDGIYRVEPDGIVNLGFSYGSAFVAGHLISDAKDNIKKHLQKQFPKTDFDVRVSLAESKAMQLIRGEHLVRPDGQVTLGSYGSVYVAGMTIGRAKAAIQAFLSERLLDPEISLDVAGYNSMVYYVIFDLDGAGQHIERMPFTGNETVLDAIGVLKGLPAGSDRFRMWIARPTAPEQECNVMPINWQAITKEGATGTNFQLMPGDRLFVAVDPFVEADGWLAKVIAPIERVFGVILLGNSAIRSFRPNNNGNNGGF